MPEEQNRTGVLAQVRNPLIFFALALLIIEGTIGLVVSQSQLTANQQFYSILLMAFLFLVVISVVAVITIWRPRNLYEEVTTLKEFINSDGFQDAIEDVLAERIKPECLTNRES